MYNINDFEPNYYIPDDMAIYTYPEDDDFIGFVTNYLDDDFDITDACRISLSTKERMNDRGRYMHPTFTIWLLDLDTDSPSVKININYSGLSTLFTSITIPFKNNIYETIDSAINKVNEIFNKDAFEYFNSDAWVDSGIPAIFNTCVKECETGADSVNYYKKLADKLKNSDLGFSIDEAFYSQLSKHILFRSDEDVEIDVDAFVYQRILRYQG